MKTENFSPGQALNKALFEIRDRLRKGQI